jgi:hypothetical protein
VDALVLPNRSGLTPPANENEALAGPFGRESSWMFFALARVQIGSGDVLHSITGTGGRRVSHRRFGAGANREIPVDNPAIRTIISPYTSSYSNPPAAGRALRHFTGGAATLQLSPQI